MAINIINKRKVEGYWNNKENRYPDFPMPVRHNKKWKKSEFLQRLSVVQKDSHQTFCKGSSRCRLCDKSNGSGEFSRGEWDWPDGLMHYVEDHGVKPSDAFIEFINKEYEAIKGE